MTSFLDKGSFIAIFVVLILLPLVSHAGGLGVAPLIFILGLMGLVLAIKTNHFKITKFQIALITFLAWLCVTALWSPYRPRRLRHLLMAAVIFAVGLLIIDLLSHFGLTLLFNPASDFNDKIFKVIDAEMNLGHSITILVLLAAPVAMLMLSQLPKGVAPWVMVFFIAFLGLAAWLNSLTVGVLGLLGVIIATLAGYASPQRIPKILLALIITVILTSPLLSFFASNYVGETGTDLPQSWDHRLRMWGYCWQVIAEHPLRGAGFDASRTFKETYIASDGREITIVSLHPHNAGVQIWTEAGLAVGALHLLPGSTPPASAQENQPTA